MMSEGAAPEGPEPEVKTTMRCHGVKVTERSLSTKPAIEAPQRFEGGPSVGLGAGRIRRRPSDQGPWPKVRYQKADGRQEQQ